MTQPGQVMATGVRLRIDFAQATDPGRDPNKQVNEDACGYAETKFGHLCVLCDGMGGHYGGREASRTAITTIFEVMEQTSGQASPAEALKGAIEEAGRRVYGIGGAPENRARPGSTVVVMLLHDRGIDVAHVGDSRAYVIRQNQIYPLTRDHSMVQGMIDAGMITEEQAIGHPDANKITRALGMKPDVEVELRPEPMELFPGDVLLQSSDGLTDLALGHDILATTRQALSSGGVQQACDTLVALANSRGGHDNITVQMARIVDVGMKPSATIPGHPPERLPESMRSPGLMHAGASAPGSTPAPPSTTWGEVPQGFTETGTEIMMTAPRPTMNEASPMQHASGPMQHASGPMQHASGPMQHAPGPPPQAYGPPQTLQNFRLDAGPASLPLPPPSSYRDPSAPFPAPSPVGFAPRSMAEAGATSRGGIVFVIIGVSTMIAILILILLWAVLRSS